MGFPKGSIEAKNIALKAWETKRKRGTDHWILSQLAKDNHSKAMQGKNKGRVPWNKNLTKEVDSRIRSILCPGEKKTKISLANLKVLGTKEHKNQQSKMMKEMWQTPNYKKHHREAEQKRQKEGRYKWQPNSKQWESSIRFGKKNPNWGKPRTKETKSKIGKANSIQMKRLWQIIEYATNQMKAIHSKPNKAELALQGILDDCFPNDWRYTGDGSLIIGGKCPDFSNINGRKVLIELFGDYWHRNEDPQDKINYYKKYGYDCLVIWEHELKDEEALKQKIMQYLPQYYQPSKK